MATPEINPSISAPVIPLLVERSAEVDSLKEHYKQFYTVLLNKVFEEPDKPIFTPKLPLEDVMLNASKVLTIKHGNESDASKFEIDNNNRQIILNGLTYKNFKSNETDGTISFIEHDPKTDVDLTMRKQKSSEIEVEDWTNSVVWMPISTYIEKLMTKYESVDNVKRMEKNTFWVVHYKNIKRIVSDLDNIFTTKEYYNL
jgi:hypothetical protein